MDSYGCDVKPGESILLPTPARPAGKPKESYMDQSLVADGSGRTVVFGGGDRNDRDQCSTFLNLQGFAAQADRHIVDTVRDSANRTQDVVHTTSAATTLAVEKVAAAGTLHLSTLAAQALVAATKDAAANLAAIERCCCEVKELVRAENGATRELIQANRSADLQAELAAARVEVIALRTAAGSASR